MRNPKRVRDIRCTAREATSDKNRCQGITLRGACTITITLHVLEREFTLHSCLDDGRPSAFGTWQPH